jgi:hypothetical protein
MLISILLTEQDSKSVRKSKNFIKYTKNLKNVDLWLGFPVGIQMGTFNIHDKQFKSG